MKEKRGASSSQEFKADVKEALDSFDQEGSELKKRMEKLQKVSFPNPWMQVALASNHEMMTGISGRHASSDRQIL